MKFLPCRFLDFRLIFSFVLLTFGISYSQAQDSSKIIMANLTWVITESTNEASLVVNLKDTIGVTGISIQIDSVEDGNGLYNSQYNLSSLPGASSVDETTILLDIGELPHALVYFTNIQLQLRDGSVVQTQIHTAN